MSNITNFPSVASHNRHLSKDNENQEVIKDFIDICKIQGKSIVWVINKWLAKGRQLTSSRIYQLLEEYGINPKTGNRYEELEIAKKVESRKEKNRLKYHKNKEKLSK